MGFEYRYTCPVIDRSINAIKSDIENVLSDMLDECCPLLQNDQKENFIKNYIDELYEYFESNFEDVRKTNEDMRKAADKQVDFLEEEIEILNSQIDDLEEKISDFKSEIETLSKI